MITHDNLITRLISYEVNVGRDIYTLRVEYTNTGALFSVEMFFNDDFITYANSLDEALAWVNLRVG